MIVIKRLIWDDWNIAHIARHDVTQEEVEQVCNNDYLILEGKKDRLIVVGVTDASRALAVILDPEAEEGVFYPVTARPADRKERHRYQVEKGGETTNDEAA